jgi:hypothetical protein
MEYGRAGVSVAMFCGGMEPDLVQEIQKLDIFSCKEDELRKRGFFKCIDYPQLEKHIYYEGYFHSCRTDGAVESINPRKGTLMAKPAAPPLLRAMYIAFREKNKEWMRGIAEELRKYEPTEQEKEEKEDTGDGGVAYYARFFDPDDKLHERLVGDLAIQVHYGEPVQNQDIGFHTDSLNSALHFAFAVRGKRRLHSFRASSEEDSNARNFGLVHVDPQEVGDVYISSPSFFRHGVEYPESTWEDRTVAIQARFLFSEGGVRKAFKVLGRGGEKYLAEVIAKALIGGPVLPSYEEILAARATLGGEAD